ncbi:hypothetical protein J6590_010951 [Homalodisca vitripennis]|nr:hypothetical protein J6590_010951 [Homalodisca vitripennis]
MNFHRIKRKAAKLKDVEKLLKTHYGETWSQNPELVYYNDVFHQQTLQIDDIEEDGEEVCEPQDESPDLRD